MEPEMIWDDLYGLWLDDHKELVLGQDGVGEYDMPISVDTLWDEFPTALSYTMGRNGHNMDDVLSLEEVIRVRAEATELALEWAYVEATTTGLEEVVEEEE
jgi:hypothetical protein